VGTHMHHEYILNNYLDIWNGDLSLINSTFSPDLAFHSDRFPSSTGVGSVAIQIPTAQAFRAFVIRSRTGWNQYTFHPYKWAADGLNIAVRWRLEAVMGHNFTLAPTTLKPGDPVTYNGTDFLLLDPCTGLIEEANIAQDLITFFHNLGLEAVTV
ncbi:hypothetical protein AOCH_002100, partial [Aspergillus ochraceoroseus]